MKTIDNNKGKICIEFMADNRPQIVYHPNVDGVWMDRNELCELFGCYLPEMEKHISALFLTDNFNPRDVSHYHLTVKGKLIEYDMYEFNLEIIAALSFLIHSWQSKLVREWFMGRVVKLACFPVSIDKLEQSYSLN